MIELSVDELALLRKAIGIGFVSWDGDDWYASKDHLGEDGTDHDEAEAIFRAAHELFSRIESGG